MTAFTNNETEETRLLPEHDDVFSNGKLSEHDNPETSQVSSIAVLPIALLAALAMAATAATTVYAYASLLCKDPTHCHESERRAYAGTVAVATCIANVCGLLALGAFEKLSRRNRKLGLAAWLVCRSMSVGALALGGESRLYCTACSHGH